MGPGSLLYVSVREFATTYPHDNKISILGNKDKEKDQEKRERARERERERDRERGTEGQKWIDKEKERKNIYSY